MKNLIEKANVYLSNLGVLYIKLHNLHWNVIGPQFKAAHEYFEGLYDFVADKLDEVAEFIKMENDYPCATLTDYKNKTLLTEIESQDYKVDKALMILLEDIKFMRRSAHDLRNISADIDKFELANMLEDHIKEYDKIIWFVESMLR